METNHKIIYNSSTRMKEIKDESIALVVCSPPYPLVPMWDESFSRQDIKIKGAIEKGDGKVAFKLMNLVLNQVWAECYRVLIDGGFACINIGDTTRKIGNDFQLYPTHAFIIYKMFSLGFQPLPNITWNKPTNSPQKFMGSGMQPPNAYVTNENEYVLIFRKGGIRKFKEKEKALRKESSFFWEERNIWYSDLWKGIIGVSQKIESKGTRERSGAFPFELAYRLINMYSIKGDTVLDPFLGTGTSILASMVSMRNCIGYEIDDSLTKIIEEQINTLTTSGNKIIKERLNNHFKFIKERIKAKGEPKYMNIYHNTPVMSKEEESIILNKIKKIIIKKNNTYSITYSDLLYVSDDISKYNLTKYLKS